MNSSNVPIADILPYTQISSSASQTVYSTNWTANVASDVVVYYTPNGTPPDDLTQILAYPADYSVAFIGGSATVQVTLTNPANSGDIVTITRQTPADRLNLYSNTNFTPSMLNTDFGILTLVDQQSQLVNQAIGPRYNYSAQINNNSMYPTRDTILPLLGPNQIWIMNPSQTEIIATDLNLVDSGTVNPGLINQVAYYAANGNIVSGLATANNGILVTSNVGAPSISSTLPSAVQLNITELGTQVQNLNMGGFLIQNGTLPSQPTDYVIKSYVDQTALTGTSVYAASASNLTVTQSGAGVGATLTNAGAQATFALDGVNPPVGVNVLIKNIGSGGTAANYGIYNVTNAGSNSSNWVLTRAASYSTPEQINDTGLIVVQNGTTLAGTAWYNSATIVTVDTTNFSYSEFGNIVFPISLAHGGTNANLTASNGGIFYSTASAGAILAGTSTANQLLMSGASTTPAWSTSTYPSTNAANTLLYASSANTMAALATANSSGLLTNGSGVPGWVAYTGTGSPVLGSAPTISSPQINYLNDQTHNSKVLGLIGVSSAVNYIAVSAAATTTSPAISATGTDTNITGTLLSSGNGGWNIQGFTDGSSASSPYVGQVITANVPYASATNIPNTTITSLTSISLTAGDWDVWGVINFIPTVSMSAIYAWVSSVNNAFPDNSKLSGMGITGMGQMGLTTFTVPVSISSTTTYYLLGYTSFSSGSCTQCGTIYARRRR